MTSVDRGLPLRTAAELRDLADTGGWVVDLRPRAVQAARHLVGSLAIDSVDALRQWAAALVPTGARVALVSDDRDTAVRACGMIAAAELTLTGVCLADLVRDPQPGLRARPVARFADLSRALRRDPRTRVVDVRSDDEWAAGHLRGAVHLPAHEVAARVDEFRHGDQPPWLYCGVGFRAAVVASYLEHFGIEAIAIDGRLAAARGRIVPWCPCRGCSDHHCTAADPGVVGQLPA